MARLGSCEDIRKSPSFLMLSNNIQMRLTGQPDSEDDTMQINTQ